MGCTYLFSGDTWGSLHAALQTCSRGLLPLWSDDLGQARARALRPAECTVLACRHDLLPVLPTPSRKAVPQQRMHLGDPVRAPRPPRPPRAASRPFCVSAADAAWHRTPLSQGPSPRSSAFTEDTRAPRTASRRSKRRLPVLR